LSKGRLSISYIPDGDPLKFTLPSRRPWVDGTRLLSLSALLSTVDGRLESAADDAALALGLARTLDNEYSYTIKLNQIQMHISTVRTLEFILASGNLSDDILLSLYETIDPGAARKSAEAAFLTERAIFIEMCDQLATGQRTPADFSGNSDVSIGIMGTTVLPAVAVREDQIRGVSWWTELIDQLDDYPAALQTAEHLNPAVWPAGDSSWLLVTLIPPLTVMMEPCAEQVALLEVTRTALAAERSRLAQGRYPETLAKLVPAYLGEVPRDPFDGEPIRLLATGDGIVIYSIGRNGVDDDGIVTAQEGERRARDVGFRLLAPEQRGVIILDESGDEE